MRTNRFRPRFDLLGARITPSNISSTMVMAVPTAGNEDIGDLDALDPQSVGAADPGSSLLWNLDNMNNPPMPVNYAQ